MSTIRTRELSDADYDKIEQLSEEGNQFYEQQKLQQALRKYEAALSIVPDPKVDWEASTWLYTSIADVNFSKGDLEQAKENYYNALNCPDGISNGYIQLSMGQTLYELEEFDKSKEFLLRAYMIEGEDIFEDEEPKYLKSISDMIDEPEKEEEPSKEYIYKDGKRFYKDEEGNLIED